MPGSPKKQSSEQQGHRKPAQLVVIPGEKVAAPPAPAGLLVRARERWDAFWSSPVSQAVDRGSDMHALVRWIKAVDEYERAMPVFQKQRVVKGSTGQPVLSPLAAYISSLETQIRAIEKAFGMDPQSRLHLGLVYGQGQLTAARLNQMIGDADASDPDADDGDWEPA